MASKKRKAADDAALTITPEALVHPRFPEPGLSEVQDRYYSALYSNGIDFGHLAKQDADFAAVLKGNGQLDFTDPAAVMQLTKTLLKLDFGLKLELPGDRLCPPVPNRHNYILWLKELMDSTSYNEPGGKLTGLDIGTGASCIYPLLGATQRPWSFIGTDIDPKSLDYARKNVKINGLEDRIRIVAKTSDDAHILPLEDCGIETVDFVMTNPPFYESEDEMITSARKKTHPPNSACTGASVEMVVDGGEMAFVGRILQESLDLRERVRWYTSMFGKLSSVYEFVERLRQNGIGNYAVTAFVQGKKTKRWAIGWSFGAMRPSDKASRGVKSTLSKSVLPPVVEIDVCTVMTDQGISPLTDRIAQVIESLELSSWVWDKEKLRGIGRASENVWGRAWRRKRKRKLEESDTAKDIALSLEHRDDDAPCRFAFLVSIRVSSSEATVGLRWLEGRESVLFESFCGFLKAQLEATL